MLDAVNGLRYEIRLFVEDVVPYGWTDYVSYGCCG